MVRVQRRSLSRTLGMSFVLVAVCSTASTAQRGAAPTGSATSGIVLTVATATKAAVTLTWTGAATPSKVIVERKALGSAWPAPPAANAPANDPNALTPATIATVDAAAYTDSKIEQFSTYVYRVRTVGAANALGAPSNEVTAGPPPVGMSLVIAAPKAYQDASSNAFASEMRMVYDANGDPLIAYVNVDVDHNGEPDDCELSVITWNRARYKWNAPTRVDMVGNVSQSATRVPFSISRDESTGRLGIAYMVRDAELRVAYSDDAGVTWTQNTAYKTPPDGPQASTPSLVLAAGKAHLAYFLGNTGVVYRAGTADAASKMTSATAPLVSGASEARAEGVNVVLDQSGKPAVFYLNNGDNYNTFAAVWRPGSASAVKIMDTKNKQNDDPGLTATVSGNSMAVGFYGARDEAFFANHHLWFAKSADNGAAWSAPVVVADDGGNTMGAPLSVTLDRAGHAAMIAPTVGGSDGANKCGQPKLMRSVDGAAWTTCAPDTKGAAASSDVTYPIGAFAGNDKLYVVFKTRQAGGGIAPGIALWRER